MKNKGFTLIELLAVIVILAIIALIATPIILGIIEDASDESIERSVENYLKAVNIAVAKENLNREFNPNSCDVTEEGNLDCDGEILTVEVDGNYPKDGTIKFTNGNVSGYDNLYIDSKYVNKGSNGVEISGYRKIVIYRNSTDTITIGDTIDVSAYTTDVTNISQNNYLKHEVVNNVVTASYACITYTENDVRKDVCVRGGDTTYYASNQGILRSVEPYFNTLDFNNSTNNYKGYCYVNVFDSGCSADSLTWGADSSGYVSAYDGSVNCSVLSDGYSYCR